jgi:3-oxoacyl-[acyl-carrier protein] reductase
LDALVNNAGGNDVRGIEELTDDDYNAQWELHVMAPMRLMRAAIPSMTQAGWGRVVNVSSTSGKRPGQRNVSYSVAKAAQLSLSRAYADAYAGRGVLINAVTPGPVATEAWLGADGLAEQTARASGTSRDDVLAAVAAGVPRGSLATAEEIASVIVFLCSGQASYVTGAAWSADGGTVPIIL